LCFPNLHFHNEFFSPQVLPRNAVIIDFFPIPLQQDYLKARNAVNTKNCCINTVNPAKRGHHGDLTRLSSLDRCPLYRGMRWQNLTPWGPSQAVLSREVSSLQGASWKVLL
jgi:hypothetical protein